MNFLVIRLSALGDVAMAIPAIYSVAQAYPEHTLTVVTSTFIARLFIGVPSNVRLMSVERGDISGVTGTWRMLRRLANEDVDAVADLHNVLRTWIIDAYFHILRKPVVMVDKMRGERGAILRQHAITSQPFVLRYFDVFARIGLPTSSRFTSLFPQKLPALPCGIPVKNGIRWIGIAPFARYRSKTLDEDCAVKLLNILARQDGTKVFLFGAQGKEAKMLCAWAKGKKHIMVVAGQLHLEEELALMSHLDVMLTMDSANMHLASLVGTRVVSVWGGTTPACGFLGYGQDLSDAVLADLPCQPCSIAGSDKCPLGHMNCVKMLNIEEIADRLLTDKTQTKI